jgi:hypothetical protein
MVRTIAPTQLYSKSDRFSHLFVFSLLPTLPPERAVVCTWYQAKGNWNMWDYDYDNAPVVEGERIIACGDWCARKETK